MVLQFYAKNADILNNVNW